ncbi:hypothetical protein QFZ20_001956 [Flavobacterium sp. W4I14]|nr:hypothetical protein [Flavobacterium sp. W4I14]
MNIYLHKLQLSAAKIFNLIHILAADILILTAKIVYF